MVNTIPNKKQLEKYLGNSAFSVWDELTKFIEKRYDFEPVWDNGGKYGIWEVKYRKGGKTLCALYVKEEIFTVLVIFGKAEREKFDMMKAEFNSKINEVYTNTRQYHDGKWLWINVSDMSLLEDIRRLITIKKKPKKKSLD